MVLRGAENLPACGASEVQESSLEAGAAKGSRKLLGRF